MDGKKERMTNEQSRVQEGAYPPLEPFLLENEDLRLVLLPNRGFKLASLFDKAKGVECLFQPSAFEEGDWGRLGKLGEIYRPRKIGDDFSHHDRSGLDDCIPTVDPCRLQDPPLETFDHGEVWSQAWQVVEAGKGEVTCRVELASMPLTLERMVSLQGRGVRLDYRLTNHGDRAYPWLWTLHGLLRFSRDGVLVLPEPFSVKNVQNEEVWDFDPRILSGLVDNHTYKFYYEGKAPKGPTEVLYPEAGLAVHLHYDQDLFPYLGVWITTGGYMGEKNLAIEPSNGYYDRLDRALENGTGDWLEAGLEMTWQVELKIQDLDEDPAGRGDQKEGSLYDQSKRK